MRETWVLSLGWEDPLEKEMATHSRVLAWRIPWMEEPGGLYSPRGHKELDTTEQLHDDPLLIDFQVSGSPAWEDSFICSLNGPFFQYTNWEIFNLICLKVSPVGDH